MGQPTVKRISKNLKDLHSIPKELKICMHKDIAVVCQFFLFPTVLLSHLATVGTAESFNCRRLHPHWGVWAVSHVCNGLERHLLAEAAAVESATPTKGYYKTLRFPHLLFVGCCLFLSLHAMCQLSPPTA